MSNAERQARSRARRATAPRRRRPQPARTGQSIDAAAPKRWQDAVAELLALQADYADWLAAMPESLHDSPMAEALEAIVDLDLAALADIYPHADSDGTKRPARITRNRLHPTTPIREDT